MTVVEKPWRDVGGVENFCEGEFRIVAVGSHEIGVMRWQGTYFAVRNVCPHAWGPLCEGHVEARLEGTPGKPLLSDKLPVVACPWHGWEFDLRSGKCIADSAWRVRTFPVREEDGRVSIQI